MIINKLTFPIIEFQTTKGPIILGQNEMELFSASKGAEKSFKNFLLIDSSGKMFVVNEVVVIGKAPLIMSLRWLQIMNKVEFHGDFIEVLSLQQVKDKLIDHIKGKMGYWRMLDDFASLKKAISDKESFEELFTFFK